MDKPGQVASGTIGVNWDKQDAKHPDFRGSIEIDGKRYYIAVWLRINEKNGRPFYSFSITKPMNRPKPTQESSGEFGFTSDDDVPF